MSKQLFNNQINIVSESIEGVLLSDSRLKRVGDQNILVREDINIYKQNHVTLISGGGSGHEPAHAGFIGNGMLSGAVLGNVFASPSISSILAAIRVCAGDKGVLLIVKNYTGDRINFGMALELAKQEGIKIKMVIVADDLALTDGKGITGARGVAGTLFVHKIAGACALNSNNNLDDVYFIAEEISHKIGSLGIALTTCNIPGAAYSKENRLSNANIFEVGLGIHGESGRRQENFDNNNANADQVADILVSEILSSDWFKKINNNNNNKYAVLINNLGSLTQIELLIVTKKLLINLSHINVTRVFIGPYMTALDMNGLSLSLVCLGDDDTMISLLDTDTTVSAWSKSSLIDLTDTTSASRSIPYDADSYAKKKIIGGIECSKAPLYTKNICTKIISIEQELTEYDKICGDGDCGIVMKAGAEGILKLINNDSENLSKDSAYFCDQIATSIGDSMGGTSGVLLEIFFRSMASNFATNGQNNSISSMNAWKSAMSDGLESIKIYGGASVGMRTIIDALEPAINNLFDNDNNIIKGLQQAVESANKGVNSTKTMASLAGRSNYISQDLMNGIPDPGAFAIAAAFSSVLDSVTKE